MRCRIGEDEQPESARAKLARRWTSTCSTPEERAFVEPRLAQLLGLGGGAAGARQDLFAAWRLFFERLADSDPVVLAFEDMQWADTRAAGLRRVPARVVARPSAVRRHPGAAGAARSPARLGRRAAPLQRALPRAARRTRRWSSCWTGSRPGLPERAARADPGPRAGRPAVCDGDGADAARPRPARSGRRRLRADRRDRHARGAGDAARADRCAAGRLSPRGAAAAAGRGGARQDLHVRSLAALVGPADRARAVARGARAQGGARAPVRSALAGARPVRLPAGPRPPRRLRDTLQARSQVPAPGRRRAPAFRVRRSRTRLPRCSPPTT